MTTKFKQARNLAGLSIKQTAHLLSIDPVSVRRFEMDPAKSTSRNPPPLALKVLDWYEKKNPPLVADYVALLVFRNEVTL